MEPLRTPAGVAENGAAAAGGGAIGGGGAGEGAAAGVASPVLCALLDVWRQLLETPAMRVRGRQKALPLFAWFCHEVLRLWEAYPTGLTLAVVLAEIDRCWISRRDAGASACSLKPYVKAGQIPTDDVIVASCAPNTPPEPDQQQQQQHVSAPSSRLCLRDQDGFEFDVMLGPNVADLVTTIDQCTPRPCLGPGRVVRMTNCRVLPRWTRTSRFCVMPSQFLVIVLDYQAQADRRIVDEHLNARGHVAAPNLNVGCNERTFGILAQVAHVWEQMRYPTSDFDRYQLIRLKVFDQGRPSHNMLLCLLDDQVALTRLANVGDTIWIHRPYVQRHADNALFSYVDIGAQLQTRRATTTATAATTATATESGDGGDDDASAALDGGSQDMDPMNISAFTHHLLWGSLSAIAVVRGWTADAAPVTNTAATAAMAATAQKDASASVAVPVIAEATTDSSTKVLQYYEVAENDLGWVDMSLARQPLLTFAHLMPGMRAVHLLGSVVQVTTHARVEGNNTALSLKLRIAEARAPQISHSKQPQPVMGQATAGGEGRHVVDIEMQIGVCPTSALRSDARFVAAVQMALGVCGTSLADMQTWVRGSAEQHPAAEADGGLLPTVPYGAWDSDTTLQSLAKSAGQTLVGQAVHVSGLVVVRVSTAISASTSEPLTVVECAAEQHKRTSASTDAPPTVHNLCKQRTLLTSGRNELVRYAQLSDVASWAAGGVCGGGAPFDAAQLALPELSSEYVDHILDLLQHPATRQLDSDSASSSSSSSSSDSSALARLAVHNQADVHSSGWCVSTPTVQEWQHWPCHVYIAGAAVFAISAGMASCCILETGTLRRNNTGGDELIGAAYAAEVASTSASAQHSKRQRTSQASAAGPDTHIVVLCLREPVEGLSDSASVEWDRSGGVGSGSGSSSSHSINSSTSALLYAVASPAVIGYAVQPGDVDGGVTVNDTGHHIRALCAHVCDLVERHASVIATGVCYAASTAASETAPAAADATADRLLRIDAFCVQAE